MKEHTSSNSPFGEALRKYGSHNFTYEFEYFEEKEDAFNREAELVTLESIQANKLYNRGIGGSFSHVMRNNNPMHDKSILENHPNIWTSDHNPMHNEDSKNKMIRHQKRKRVSIDGIVYEGVREAARELNVSRQFLIYRLKAKSFNTWYYV